MTTNANAPVETRHKDEAKLRWLYPGEIDGDEQRFAQTLADLEAARADVARLKAEKHKMVMRGLFARTCAQAEENTPSPCPGCAAKDEAMAAFKAEVSNQCSAVVEVAGKYYVQATSNTISTHLSRFIIPPADPVAEALQNLIALARPHFTDEAQMIALEQATAALAELKSRPPLGGAK